MKLTSIYAIVCKNDGRVYIGKSVNVKRRWTGHCSLNGDAHIQNAIRKYGKENFDFKVIEEVAKELANEREKFWIHVFGSYDPKLGFNETHGGDGFDTETARKVAKKRVENGTHHFLSLSKERSIKGTHHFIGGDIVKKSNTKRISEGTHNFLGGEFARSKSKRPLVSEVRELYRKLNLKMPRSGVHFKSDEWLLKTKEELLHYAIK